MIKIFYRHESLDARDAIETIHGQTASAADGWPPSVTAVADAWRVLERIDLPVAGLCRACQKLDLPLPRCRAGMDVGIWWDDTRKLPTDKIDRIAESIWRGADIRAWPALEDAMSREIVRRSGRLRTEIVNCGGPDEKREVHLRDSRRTGNRRWGRVISCEMFEFGRGGRLEVRDHGGGTISPVTIARSGWEIHEGWVQVARRGTLGGGGGVGGQNKGNDDGDEGTPPPAVDLEPPQGWTP